MKARILSAFLVLETCTLVSTPLVAYAHSIEEDMEDIANLHYEQANTKLIEIILDAHVAKKQKCLLLLARLKSSP